MVGLCRRVGNRFILASAATSLVDTSKTERRRCPRRYLVGLLVTQIRASSRALSPSTCQPFVSAVHPRKTPHAQLKSVRASVGSSFSATACIRRTIALCRQRDFDVRPAFLLAHVRSASTCCNSNIKSAPSSSVNVMVVPS